MLHDGPAFDRLCRDVDAARPDPLPMGVAEAEREASAGDVRRELERMVRYLRNHERGNGDPAATVSYMLRFMVDDAESALESEARRGS